MAAEARLRTCRRILPTYARRHDPRPRHFAAAIAADLRLPRTAPDRRRACCCPPGAAGRRPRRSMRTSPFRRMTDAQWRERLPAASYQTLRHEATERPGTSPLNNEHRARDLRLPGLRPAAVPVGVEVRQRHGLAQLLRRHRRQYRHQDRLSRSASRARNITAPAAWGTRATSSTTGRGRPASATATTAWR